MAAEAMAMAGLGMAAWMPPFDDSGVAISDVSRKIADIVVVSEKAAPALNPAKAALPRVCWRDDGEDADQQSQDGDRPRFPPNRRRRAKSDF
jgi:hypothetical protein